MNGDMQLAWDTIQYLVILGFSIGVVIAVIFGAAKLGFKYAHWIVIIAALIWFFG